MGIFPFKFFSKKKTEPATQPPMQSSQETARAELTQLTDDNKKADMDRVRAKLDLILTELDSLKILNQTLNERLRNIENKISENKDRIRYV